jgi:hypothetical protein
MACIALSLAHTRRYRNQGGWRSVAATCAYVYSKDCLAARTPGEDQAMDGNGVALTPLGLRSVDENRSNFLPEQLVIYAGQHMAWSAVVVVKVSPDHGGYCGSGQPINLAMLIQVPVVVSEQ